MILVGPQSIGSSRVYRLTLSGPLDDNGQPTSLAGVFNGTETFKLVVWPGDDRLPVWTSLSALAWDSAVTGNPASLASPILKLTIPRVSIATIAPGRYSIQGWVNPGTDDVEILPEDSFLELTSVPGLVTAGRFYCTLDDCRKECPWILEAVSMDPGIPNNLEPFRQDAREWYDDLIQRHWRGGTSLGAEGGLLSRRRSGQRNVWLKQQLDAGALMLTPAVIKANTYYALGMALDHLIGQRGTTTYQELARQYFAEAEHRAVTTSAELDTNADGQPDFAVDLGYIDVLVG